MWVIKYEFLIPFTSFSLSLSLSPLVQNSKFCPTCYKTAYKWHHFGITLFQFWRLKYFLCAIFLSLSFSFSRFSVNSIPLHWTAFIHHKQTNKQAKAHTHTHTFTGRIYLYPAVECKSKLNNKNISKSAKLTNLLICTKIWFCCINCRNNISFGFLY